MQEVFPTLPSASAPAAPRPRSNNTKMPSTMIDEYMHRPDGTPAPDTISLIDMTSSMLHARSFVKKKVSEQRSRSFLRMSVWRYLANTRSETREHERMNNGMQPPDEALFYFICDCMGINDALTVFLTRCQIRFLLLQQHLATQQAKKRTCIYTLW